MIFVFIFLLLVFNLPAKVSSHIYPNRMEVDEHPQIGDEHPVWSDSFHQVAPVLMLI